MVILQKDEKKGHLLNQRLKKGYLLQLRIWWIRPQIMLHNLNPLNLFLWKQGSYCDQKAGGSLVPLLEGGFKTNVDATINTIAYIVDIVSIIQNNFGEVNVVLSKKITSI